MFGERLSKFDKIIIYLVDEFGGLDLKESNGVKEKSLWEGIILVRQTRNKIVHKGEGCNTKQLISAEQIVTVLLEKAIPNLMRKLRLKIDNSFLVVKA